MALCNRRYLAMGMFVFTMLVKVAIAVELGEIRLHAEESAHRPAA